MTGEELQHEQVVIALSVVLMKTYQYVPADLVSELAWLVCDRVIAARNEHADRLAALPANSRLAPEIAAEALRDLRGGKRARTDRGAAA
jgi:hypothetical protein